VKHIYFHLTGGTVVAFHSVSDEHAGEMIAWAQQEPATGGKNSITFTTEKTDKEQGGTHVFLRSGVGYIEVRESP
jgi:hypothetical protein